MRRWLVWIAVAVAVPALVGGWLLRPGSLDSAYLVPIAVSFVAVGALLALKRPEQPDRLALPRLRARGLAQLPHRAVRRPRSALRPHGCRRLDRRALLAPVLRAVRVRVPALPRRAPGLAAVALGGVGRRRRLRPARPHVAARHQLRGPGLPGGEGAVQRPGERRRHDRPRPAAVLQPAAAAGRGRVAGGAAAALDRPPSRAGAAVRLHRRRRDGLVPASCSSRPAAPTASCCCR